MLTYLSERTMHVKFNNSLLYSKLQYHWLQYPCRIILVLRRMFEKLHQHFHDCYEIRIFCRHLNFFLQIQLSYHTILHNLTCIFWTSCMILHEGTMHRAIRPNRTRNTIGIMVKLHCSIIR